MNGDAPPPRQGPVQLSDLLDGAARMLGSKPKGHPAADGYLFSGNRHENVPRGLFLDRRLTPLERNAWQVFRILLNEDGLTAFPTYDQLRPWLASMPCNAQASHETVARALTLLRLTRWLSLVRRQRDIQTGRIQGNLYVLHDEPLTPFEAMQLDAEYLGLVSQALSHAAKAIQVVGLQTLKEILDDPLLSGRTLPTRLHVLTERMAQAGWQQPGYPQTEADHDSEETIVGILRNQQALTSESEPGVEAAQNQLLRNPNEVSTVRSSNSKKERTVLQPPAPKDLILPNRFNRLRQEQQAGAMAAMLQVEFELRQPILDEWDARCGSNSVRSPAGYLFGIIQKAIKGEFKAWVGTAKQQSTGSPPPSPSPEPHQVVPPEVARANIARLRELLRKG